MIKRHHYVYVLQDAEFCKIGHAADPGARLKDLLTGSPRDLCFVHLFQFADRTTAIAVEGETHRYLSNSHVRGEWFGVSPDDAARAVRISSAAAGHFRFERRGKLELAHGCLSAPSGSFDVDQGRRSLRLQFAEEHSGNASGNGR